MDGERILDFLESRLLSLACLLTSSKISLLYGC